MLTMYFSNLLTLILMSVVFGAVIQPIHGQSAGINTNFTVPKVTSVPENKSSASGDTAVPIVRLVDPNWCNAVGTGKIVVNGTSSDNGTGVQIVEVRVDKNKYLTTAQKSLETGPPGQCLLKSTIQLLIEYWPGPLTTPEIRIGRKLR